MDIVALIENSFADASRSLVMGTSAATLERARTRVFVKSLAERLQAAYTDETVRVFSHYGRSTLAEFGSETLLYDISAHRVARGSTAARQPEEYHYIREALWQIEVDFTRDWRSALAAINRLIGGAAQDKLLVAAQSSKGDEALRQTLATPFACCGGRAHLALVPHPADWDSSERAAEVWRLDAGNWSPAAEGETD